MEVYENMKDVLANAKLALDIANKTAPADTKSVADLLPGTNSLELFI